MPAKPPPAYVASLVSQLRSEDVRKVLPALRRLKNDIIGNRQRKQAYTRCGLLACILEVYQKHEDTQVLIEAAVTLGSFAYNNPEGVIEIVTLNGVPRLVSGLFHGTEKLVLANLRALKNTCRDPDAPRRILQNEQTLLRLVAFLEHPESQLSGNAAFLLSECCLTNDEKKALAAAGVVPALQRLLSSPRHKTQEAAAEALAAICADSKEVGAQLLASRELLDSLAACCRDPDPRLQLAACSTVAHVACHAQVEDAPLKQRVADMAQDALLVLTQLLGDEALRRRVPRLLALLLCSSPSLVKVAIETDVVRQLSALLVDPTPAPTPARHGALSALACLCMASEDCLRQLATARGLPAITAHLQDDSQEVRSAAALCAKALSRPAPGSQTSLLEAGALLHLVRLARDAPLDVQMNAVGAITNLVLECTSAEEVVAGEGLPTLLGLLDSMDCGLRRQAAWALSNLSTLQSDSLRRRLLADLPWSTVRQLLSDPEASVQLHALKLVRNLAPSSGACNSQGILEWASGELLPLLEARLQNAASSPPPPPAEPEALEHALYAASNLATCPPGRAAVMASSIPALLPTFLTPASPLSTLLPATWCVINLSWVDDPPPLLASELDGGMEADPPEAAGDAFSQGRIAALNELGLPDVLREVLDHVSDPAVQNCVKTALEQLKM